MRIKTASLLWTLAALMLFIVAWQSETTVRRIANIVAGVLFLAVAFMFQKKLDKN